MMFSLAVSGHLWYCNRVFNFVETQSVVSEARKPGKCAKGPCEIELNMLRLVK